MESQTTIYRLTLTCSRSKYTAGRKPPPATRVGCRPCLSFICPRLERLLFSNSACKGEPCKCSYHGRPNPHRTSKEKGPGFIIIMGTPEPSKMRAPRRSLFCCVLRIRFCLFVLWNGFTVRENKNQQLEEFSGELPCLHSRVDATTTSKQRFQHIGSDPRTNLLDSTP